MVHLDYALLGNAALLLSMGLSLLRRALKRKRLQNALSEAKLFKPGEARALYQRAYDDLHAGNFSLFIACRGEIHGEHLLHAPYSHKACALYQAEEHLLLRHGGEREIYRQQGRADFVLSDGENSLPVDFEKSPPLLDEDLPLLSEQRDEDIPNKFKGPRAVAYRKRERGLAAGERVTIYGELNNDGGELNLAKPSRRGEWVLTRQKRVHWLLDSQRRLREDWRSAGVLLLIGAVLGGIRSAALGFFCAASGVCPLSADRRERFFRPGVCAAQTKIMAVFRREKERCLMVGVLFVRYRAFLPSTHTRSLAENRPQPTHAGGISATGASLALGV